MENSSIEASGSIAAEVVRQGDETAATEISNGGVVMVQGDIFAAPANSVLVHACNCQGSWGAGIALAFKSKYPAAYRIYNTHCTTRSNPSSLLGTTLLIPPQPTDPDSHWIGCLFTSVHYGRRVDSPERILQSTAEAFEHLVNQVANIESAGEKQIGEMHACKINSGRFGVDWGRSKRVMDGILEDEGKGRTVTVYEFEEEVGGGGSSSSRGRGGGRGGRGGRGMGRGGRGRGGLERGQQRLTFG
ncbi:hypothetical protein ABW19_dt0204263 [Dactylella cylindrospora]|nr:hypothetical protein ABW19_dt0204263 [Dactylella cylindrospora]